MKTEYHEPSDLELVRQWRVEGFYKFVDCNGNRFWKSDWGPRPSEDNVTLVGNRYVAKPADPRPLPPPHLPYKD